MTQRRRVTGRWTNCYRAHSTPSEQHKKLKKLPPVFLFVGSHRNMSLIGIVVLFLIAYALSSARRSIKWRTIIGAFAFQVFFAAFALYVPWGQSVMATVSDAVSNLEVYGNQGISFLFGGLNDSALMAQLFGNHSFIFALKVLPLIVFFSGLMAVLYHIGVMGVIIRVFGGSLGRVLGTSRTGT